MTPTTPPAIPSDIPEWVAELAAKAHGEFADSRVKDNLGVIITRALMAAQERGKLMERERCAGIADADWEKAGVFIARAIREGN